MLQCRHGISSGILGRCRRKLYSVWTNTSMLLRMASRSKAIFTSTSTNSCGALFQKRYFGFGHNGRPITDNVWFTCRASQTLECGRLNSSRPTTLSWKTKSFFAIHQWTLRHAAPRLCTEYRFQTRNSSTFTQPSVIFLACARQVRFLMTTSENMRSRISMGFGLRRSSWPGLRSRIWGSPRPLREAKHVDYRGIPYRISQRHMCSFGRCVVCPRKYQL